MSEPGFTPAPLDQGRCEARCGTCDHEWVVAYLPMPLERAAALMAAARCPRGCDAQVCVA